MVLVKAAGVSAVGGAVGEGSALCLREHARVIIFVGGGSKSCHSGYIFRTGEGDSC